MMIHHTNALLSRSQSLQLLFDENTWWRKLCFDYFGMETIEYEYDRFLRSLQTPIAEDVGRQIRFKLRGPRQQFCEYSYRRRIDLLQQWDRLCTTFLQNLIFSESIVTKRLMWFDETESNTLFSFVVRAARDFDNVRYYIEEIVLSPFDCTLSGEEQQLTKFSDYLTDVVCEQEIIEKEITSVDRLNTLSTVLHYELNLPDVIVVCLLQYFRNVTVTNSKRKTVLINE